MRFYRNLIILCVVFVALLAAYIFLPKHNTDNTGAKKISVKSFNKDKITGIELTNIKGIFSFSKSGTDWKMVKPKSYKLDKVLTDSFIDGVTNIKAEDLVEENAKDLEVYGLKKPGATITVKTSDGLSTIISLGSESPIGGDYYLKTTDSGNVYRVDSYTAGDFLRGLTEFRDKAVFDFKADDVTELVFTKQGKEVWKLTKQGGWKVTEAGVQSEGNQTEISNVVNEVSGLKVKDYVVDNPTVDLAAYGLASPQYTINIKTRYKPEENLVLGKTEDTGIYTKKTSGTDIFTISKDSIGFLDKTAKDFIKK